MNLFRIVGWQAGLSTGANEWGKMMIDAGVYVLAKPEPA